MTVRELRDRLNELIKKDASYSDAPVYYDDAELNLRPIETEEVYVIQAIQQPSFRHNSLNPGDIFCSLNINRYECEELDYWTGGAMVIPPDVLKNHREEVMKYIAKFIADEVFKYNYAMDFNRQFKNVQYTDETKERMKIFFQDFGDRVEDEFSRRWNEELTASFTPDEVAKIRRWAKKVPFKVELTGDKEDSFIV